MKIKPTHVAVALFLVGFLLIRCAEAETIFEAAPNTAFIAGNHYDGALISATERFGKYDIGVTLASSLNCECERGDSPGNLGIHAQRIVTWKRLEMGLGAAYWQNQTPAWNSNTTFALSVGLDLDGLRILGLRLDRWRITHRHYSTGGASDRNGGLDLLTIGYSFP